MDCYPKPSWATEYTPCLSGALDRNRHWRSVEMIADHSVNDATFFNEALPLVGITAHRRRPRWWWPFGKRQWVVSFFFQRPAETGETP
jgi:hypothetical protein